MKNLKQRSLLLCFGLTLILAVGEIALELPAQAFPRVDKNQVTRDFKLLADLFPHLKSALKNPYDLLRIYDPALNTQLIYRAEQIQGTRVAEPLIRPAVGSPPELLAYLAHPTTLYYLLEKVIQIRSRTGQEYFPYFNLFNYWMNVLYVTGRHSAIGDILQEYPEYILVFTPLMPDLATDIKRRLDSYQFHLGVKAPRRLEAQVPTVRTPVAPVAEDLLPLSISFEHLGPTPAIMAVNAVPLAYQPLANASEGSVGSAEASLESPTVRSKRKRARVEHKNSISNSKRSETPHLIETIRLDHLENEELTLLRTLIFESKIGNNPEENLMEALDFAQSRKNPSYEAEVLLAYGDANIDPVKNYTLALDIARKHEFIYTGAEALLGLAKLDDVAGKGISSSQAYLRVFKIAEKTKSLDLEARSRLGLAHQLMSSSASSSSSSSNRPLDRISDGNFNEAVQHLITALFNARKIEDKELELSILTALGALPWSPVLAIPSSGKTRSEYLLGALKLARETQDAADESKLTILLAQVSAEEAR